MGSRDSEDFDEFEDPDDFNGADEFDTAFDEHLRGEFSRTFPPMSAAQQTFSELSPTFTRARRTQQAKQVLVGVAASLVFVAGIGFGTNLVSERSGDGATVAGQPETGQDADSTTDQTSNDPTDAVAVTGTTAGAAADDPSGSNPDQQATSVPVTTMSTGQAPPTDSTPPSTTPATTTTSVPASPGTTEVDSECGTIVVSVSGSDVTLIESQPKTGYSVDEKSTGPESIEVSFEGPRDHCEVKAEVRNGELYIDKD